MYCTSLVRWSSAPLHYPTPLCLTGHDVLLTSQGKMVDCARHRRVEVADTVVAGSGRHWGRRIREGRCSTDASCIVVEYPSVQASLWEDSSVGLVAVAHCWPLEVARCRCRCIGALSLCGRVNVYGRRNVDYASGSAFVVVEVVVVAAAFVVGTEGSRLLVQGAASPSCSWSVCEQCSLRLRARGHRK